MGIYNKLLAIQTELKAPKSQYNNFGKYKYRNCEDILEAVKPLLAKTNTTLFITDTVELIGTRFYVKATATLVSCEDESNTISVSAYAREEENKKGMDGSQVTGASSSYARKYALNGLFAIDDTKDSDTTNVPQDNAAKPQNTKPPVQQKKSQLSKDTSDRLNNALMSYTKLTNYKMNNVIVQLQNEIGKNIKDFTEKDAEKVLELLAEWQTAFMNELGV